METSDESTTDCANGSVQIDVGYDDGLAADGTTPAGSADDGSLDAGEIDTTEIVCDVVDGTDGTGGVSALIIRSEASTDDCPDGRETIHVGLDDNGYGALDSDEVEQTVHVCNGLNGIDGDNGAQGQTGTYDADALVSVTAEPASENCVHGNDKVETGLDDAANGTLDEAEVGHTTYLCDGAQGADGMHGAEGTDGESGNRALTNIVTLETGSEECTAGGVVVRSGIETDRDRILVDNEVDETVVVCNGTNGTVDEDKNGTDDRHEVEAQASCAATSNSISLRGLLALAGSSHVDAVAAFGKIHSEKPRHRAGIFVCPASARPLRCNSSQKAHERDSCGFSSRVFLRFRAEPFSLETLGVSEKNGRFCESADGRCGHTGAFPSNRWEACKRIDQAPKSNASAN